jgi:hypothetical protein
MELSVQLTGLEKKLRRGVKEGTVTAPDYATQLEQAVAADVLSAEEADQLRDLDAKVMNLIHVDEFQPEALQRTPSAPPASRSKTKAVAAVPPPEAMQA